MSVTARRRRLRALAAATSALAIGTGLAVAVSVAGSAPHAAANPSGGSPQLYLTGNLGSRGQLDRFSLDSVLAGGAVPNNNPSSGDAPLGPVAVNVTATKAVVGAAAVSSTVAIPPSIGVVDVDTGVGVGTGTQQTPVAIAADPTNASIVYVLEGNGSSGQIDRVNVSSNPPGDTFFASGSAFASNICCALTSLAIAPNGQTLFVGEQGDGFASIGVVPVGNPAGAFAWSWPRGRDGVDLNSIADLVVAPDGQALYATGPGFNTSGGGSEGDVFALSLPISSVSQVPIWSRALTSGTANPVVQLSVPTCLTVSPDGTTVDIGGNDGPNTLSVVQSISAGGSPTRFNQVPMSTNANGGQGLTSIVFAPDGRNLLVSGIDGGGSSTASIFPLGAGDLSVGPSTTLPVRFNQAVPESLAITPDQAPTAGLGAPAAVQVGHSITFDASSSTVKYGSVNNFAWDFGDGGTTTTGSPVVSHTYATPGNFAVTVTETDSAGTSITTGVAGVAGAVDGPGQTPYRRADPSPRVSVTILVTATPPTTGPTTTVHGQGTTTTIKGHPAAGAPTLVLNPAVGTPGTLVTVTGHGFKANTPVTVSWSVSTGSVVITADSHGNLPPKLLLILTPDVLGPRFAQASSTPQATAPFLVVPGTSEPGGDNAGLLFRSEGP